MQCLFAGMTLEELDDASASFYNGLAVVNNDYFYAMPQTPGYGSIRGVSRRADHHRRMRAA